jgi:hypothetical protein
MHVHMSRCTVTCHDARSHERKKKQGMLFDLLLRRVSALVDAMFRECSLNCQLLNTSDGFKQLSENV